MKSGKKFLLAVLLLVATFGAFESAASEWPMAPVEKLGRGIANVAFGPLEILMKPYDVNNDQGAIPALTFGVLKGVCYVVAREIVGVIDIVTFLVPLPGCPDDALDSGWGYGPIMRPAWVVDVDHNAYNFFYNENTVIEPR